ncbi:hypothetical protein Ahy_B08g090242 [Arachis hypogaea]|uniref:Uncharacterized protein n=1 Tax=Arachis hypogaea TaxID=3818 RepID=A0A444XZS9_ARAHY|nr:hypothetical protein Ahy_B08g090242 [Arachis hypogaea]
MQEEKRQGCVAVEEVLFDLGNEAEDEGRNLECEGGGSHGYIDMGGLRSEDVLLMEFNTPEEAIGFYNIYSRIKGFATRQGKKRKDGSRKWHVSQFVDEYNHELVLGKFVDFLRSHKKISEVDIAHLTSMRDIGISIPKIYESFVAQLAGFNMITFTKQDMYNERCVNFLKDNEDKLEFQSCYGTPVLQTQFIELKKSGATRFMHEMFWRYRESLKRCVRVRINDCVEIEGGQMFNIQKFHKPEMAWQVKHENATNTFMCSCLRMESFGLPCVHILVVLVQLDVVVIPDSLGGGVKDPVCARTKGTGRGNQASPSTGRKRWKCNSCGRLGHQRTRCPGVAASGIIGDRLHAEAGVGNKTPFPLEKTPLTEK